MLDTARTWIGPVHFADPGPRLHVRWALYLASRRCVYVYHVRLLFIKERDDMPRPVPNICLLRASKAMATIHIHSLSWGGAENLSFLHSSAADISHLA